MKKLFLFILSTHLYLQAAQVSVIKSGTGLFPVIGTDDALYCSIFNGLPIKSTYHIGMGILMAQKNLVVDYLSKPESLKDYLFPIKQAGMFSNVEMIQEGQPNKILYKLNDVLGQFGQKAATRMAYMEWSVTELNDGLGTVRVKFKKICNPKFDQAWFYLKKEGPDGTEELVMNPQGNDIKDILQNRSKKVTKEIVYLCGQIDIKPSSNPNLTELTYQSFMQLTPQNSAPNDEVSELVLSKLYKDFYSIIEENGRPKKKSKPTLPFNIPELPIKIPGFL